MVAVVLLLAPLMAVAQPRAREARPDSSADRSRGDMQVVNDWRDVVNVSMWSESRERIGEWVVRPGERVILGEARRPIRVRPTYKIKVGDNWGWVDLGQVGQFQNGVWHVNVRNIWAATQQDRPEGRDSRRGEGPPRDTPPRGEDSALDQILKKIK